MSEAVAIEKTPAPAKAGALNVDVPHAVSVAVTSKVSLLTGCQDKPYALGLASALSTREIALDFIGSDQISGPEVKGNRFVRFLNLRGDQRREASFSRKVSRILIYYARLIRYVTFARPKIFHILWTNKFEVFDRIVLQSYYKLLGKRVVFTAHNVNAGRRDASNSWLNRLSLRIGYSLCDHILVHTPKMKQELCAEFNVPENQVTIIPFGINSTVPMRGISQEDARQSFGLSPDEKVILFFGNIAPYKGLEYLIEALQTLSKKDRYRVVIAGPVKGCPEYWKQIQDTIERTGTRKSVSEHVEFIPDDQVELFFMAADLLVLPYTHIFQSGVLALGYNFGLPVVAADVGSLKEDILENETGFVCAPQDPRDLAAKIETFFRSDLYKDLPQRRANIRAFAHDRFSWHKSAAITEQIYRNLSPRAGF